jgi:hypothetical protein
MKFPLIVWIVLVSLLPMAQAGDANEAAVTSAKIWLALVDDGQYAKSWSEAAPFFKERVQEEEWVRTVGLVRGPFGAVKSRELIGARHTKSLPGAPDGEYVVIQFKTSFENKAEAIETVTPMKTPDGEWKVSGYYVK